MHAGTFNLVARSNSGGAVNGYFLAGPGVYYRKVELTSPGVGFITVCDPYWLICYPTAVETDRILGDRSSTDFGMNFGGGITFGHDAKFYVEARYHYVWGKKITAPGGGTEDLVQRFVLPDHVRVPVLTPDSFEGVNTQPPTPNSQGIPQVAHARLEVGSWELGVGSWESGVDTRVRSPRGLPTYTASPSTVTSSVLSGRALSPTGGRCRGQWTGGRSRVLSKEMT